MNVLRVAYIVFASSVILFLLVVTSTHVALTTYNESQAASRYRGLPEVVKRNYAHMAPADVDDLLKATATMRYRFAPWVGMRERPVTSRFVNVNAHGIRSNGRPLGSISEIRDAIWFFGGSTTFGYGVTDEESIPAQLEKAIGHPVMNFGVAAFFSAQENLQLVQFLRFGYRPSKVVFLDGINEACDVVDYEAKVDPRFEQLLDLYRWDPKEIAKPVLYAASKLGDRVKTFMGIDRGAPDDDELTCASPEGPRTLRTVHGQMLAEREVLCRLYALECTTFVQPFPGMHGRHDDPQSLPERTRSLYRDKFELLEESFRSAGAIFVTDALDHHLAHAYLDSAHYSSAANKLIAHAIAGHMGAPLR